MMDIAGGVTNFKRRIFDFTVNPLDDNNSPPSSYQLNELTITGQAFLRHQVQCMASILFLIGSGLEQPEVIDYMLDVEKCPRKPQYGMAADYPLILYDCGYEDIKWEVDEYYYRNILKHFQQLWTKQMINTTMICCMLDSLELPLSHSDDHTSLPSDQMSPLIKSDHKLGGSYKSFLTHPSSDFFEIHYEHHQSKKRKIKDI